MLCKETVHEFRISYIAADKAVAGIALQGSEVLEVASVGKLIEIDDGVFLKGDPVEDKIGADESGTASDEDGGHDYKAIRLKTVGLLGRKTVFRR
jgi:hypothetical protein